MRYCVVDFPTDRPPINSGLIPRQVLGTRTELRTKVPRLLKKLRLPSVAIEEWQLLYHWTLDTSAPGFVVPPIIVLVRSGTIHDTGRLSWHRTRAT